VLLLLLEAFLRPFSLAAGTPLPPAALHMCTTDSNSALANAAFSFKSPSAAATACCCSPATPLIHSCPAATAAHTAPAALALELQRMTAHITAAQYAARTPSSHCATAEMQAIAEADMREEGDTASASKRAGARLSWERGGVGGGEGCWWQQNKIPSVLADLLLATETTEARDSRACGISIVVEDAQAHAAAERRFIQASRQAAGVGVGVGLGVFEGARTHGGWKGGGGGEMQGLCDAHTHDA